MELASSDLAIVCAHAGQWPIWQSCQAGIGHLLVGVGQHGALIRWSWPSMVHCPGRLALIFNFSFNIHGKSENTPKKTKKKSEALNRYKTISMKKKFSLRSITYIYRNYI